VWVLMSCADARDLGSKSSNEYDLIGSIWPTREDGEDGRSRLSFEISHAQ
jgi:hypothetical protein